MQLPITDNKIAAHTNKIVYERYLDVSIIYLLKQVHPRGSIVDPQGLHQDGPNSLPYNGLKTPIIISYVYDIF